MAGKLQNSDHKSEAELIGLGATKTELINTDKVYTAKSDSVLETTLRKNNFGAIVDPDITDDSTINYEVGSRWINTTSGARFELVDNTVGAAVWKKGGAGGEGKLNFILIGTQEEAVITDYETGKDTEFPVVNFPFLGNLEISNTDPFRGEFSLLYTNAATPGDSTDDWIKRNTNIPAGYRRDSLLDYQFQYSSSYADGDVRVHLIEQPSGNVLIDEPLNNHVSGPTGDAQEFKVRVPMRDDTTSMDWGFHIINGTAAATLKVDDVILTPELGFIEQNVIESNPDSSIRLAGDVFYGSTNTFVLRFDTILQNLGSDVEYVPSLTDGDHFLIKRAGIYNINAAISFNGSNGDFIISKNAVGNTTAAATSEESKLSRIADTTNGASKHQAASVFLEVGDKIDLRTTFVTTIRNDLYHQFTISRVGSTEIFAPLINQKVKIPTSTIRLEGCSSNGTGLEDHTLQYDNLISTSGDALTVDNANGTIINVKKDGVVHVTGTARFAADGTGVYLTLNAIDRTISTPPAAEIKAAKITTSVNDILTLTTSFKVKVGDKIRMLYPSGFVAHSSASFEVVHQEQEVGVNINTVLPQFEDEDSMIRVLGANGHGSTNTKIRRFLSILDIFGDDITYLDDSANGGSFTVNSTGMYHLSGTGNTNVISTVGITKNSSELTTSISALVNDADRLTMETPGSANFSVSFSWAGILQKGDIIRFHTDGATHSDVDAVTFTIAKQANPSVIGIDGKQLEVFTKDPDSMIRLDTGNGVGAIGTGIRRISTVRESFGDAILFEDSVNNGSSFTVQEDGVYHITYSEVFSAAQHFGISKNASNLATNIYSLPEIERLVNGYANGNTTPDAVSWSGILKVGDIIRPQISLGASESGTPERVNFTMTKIGELRQIIPLENQTVEIPSSELKVQESTGLGTGAEASTIQFTNLQFINGEALSLDNANGTILTILTDGVLTISASGKANGTLWLTKNTADASASPLTDEILTLVETGGDAIKQLSWSGTVKAGDKFRMAGTTSSAAGSSHFNAVHQELDVEVAINNIEPQYEDNDSMVRLHTGNGVGAVATMIRRFANLSKQLGSAVTYKDSADEGASFTINESGIYSLTYGDVSPAGIANFGFTLNSSELSTVMQSVNPDDRLAMESCDNATNSNTAAWTGYLQAGDVVRPHTNGNVTTSSNQATFTIAMQGKASVIGIDGNQLLAFEEEADSSIELDGGNGHGSVRTLVRRFRAVINSSGNAIRYHDSPTNGSSFEILEDGVYDISYNEITGPANILGIGRNITNFGSPINNLTLTEGKLAQGGMSADTGTGHVSWQGELKVGDIITLQQAAAGGADHVYITATISKQGKLKNLIPTTDQKVDIPTSELKFQGLNAQVGRLMKAESASIIDGDGMSFINDTVSALVIKAEKDGMMSITYSAQMNGVSNIVISKNATSTDADDLTRDETLASSTASTNDLHNISWAGKVKAGDLFRFHNSAATPNESQDADGHYNTITCFHMETEVEVAITNVEPQFEDVDSMIRVNSGTGFGTNASNKIRVFDNLVNNLGLAITYNNDTLEGDSFVINESGIYHISYSDVTSANRAHGVSKNASLTAGFLSLTPEERLFTFQTNTGGSDRENGAWSGYLQAGDVIRAHADSTTNYGSDSGAVQFTIAKQGKPSVIGIDGRPVDAFRQEPDSQLKVSTVAGAGAVDTRVAIFTKLILNEGGSIRRTTNSDNGDIFEVLSDGTYSLNYTMADTAGSNQEFGVTKNAEGFLTTNLGTVLANNPELVLTNSRTKSVSGLVSHCSWTGILKKGDRIRCHAHSVGFNGGIESMFNISKIGDIKRVSTTIDSTVEIPTSEIKMQGVPAMGTGVEARTVKWPELANISGDGLIVDNSIGTIITVKKDGIVSMSASIGSGGTLYLTKNSPERTSGSQEAQYVFAASAPGVSESNRVLQWSGKVVVGDKLRVWNNSLNANGFSSFNIVHTETEVAVAISNIDPQFQDPDSSVRALGSTLLGSTNTFIRRFLTVESKIGKDVLYTDSVVDGAGFTALTNGIYNVSYGEQSNGASTMFFGISKNTTQGNLETNSVTDGSMLIQSDIAAGSDYRTISWSGYLNAGDTIRPHAGINRATNVSHRISMTMARSGKPTLTGLDVTEFLQAPSIISQFERFDDHAGYGATATKIPFFTSKSKTDGSGLFRIDNDSINGLVVTILRDCMGSAAYTSRRDAVSFFGITLNSNQLSTNFQTVDHNNSLASSMRISGGVGMTATTGLINFKAGDKIRPHSDGGTMDSNSDLWFTFGALSDEESTISETADIANSDTMDFVYKGSALTKDDPIGTFATYTFAASTNTPVVTATPPTQVISEFNRDGLKVFPRAFNAASTAALPARIDVQIGLGHKNVELNAFFDINKVTELDIQIALPASSTQRGLHKSYNPTTGILTIDVGINQSGLAVTAEFLDLRNGTTRASGFITIQASTKVPLVNMPSRKYAVLKDIKAGTTNGGDFNSGAWQVRDINTIEGDSSIVQLTGAPNGFKLQPGKYRISAEASVRGVVNECQARIFNFTTGLKEITGKSHHVGGGDDYVFSPVTGVIEITEETVFQLQHRCQTTNLSDGFGRAITSWTTEQVYSTIEIEKLL